MKMKTLEALKGSIKKWEKIHDGTGMDEGRDNCALCQRFQNEDCDCDGCPVEVRTGLEGCEETPYEDWMDHMRQIHDLIPCSNRIQSGCEKCKELAKAELDFLKSLLPEVK